MWTNPEINASDAFVAAWLPGTEGGGVADVIVGDVQGQPRHDFQGTLSFSWPRIAGGAPLNHGDPEYDPQFAYGYGLTYALPASVPRLSVMTTRATDWIRMRSSADICSAGRTKMPPGRSITLASMPEAIRPRI